MNYLNYRQEFRKALSTLEYFEDETLHFLRRRTNEIRYYDADYPLLNLLSMIPALSYQLKEFALFGNRYNKLLVRFIDSLSDVDDNLESISLSIQGDVVSIKEELERLWQLFDEAYKEIQKVLDCDFLFNFDLDKKMEWIKKKR
jgi:hypothetical protein